LAENSVLLLALDFLISEADRLLRVLLTDPATLTVLAVGTFALSWTPVLLLQFPMVKQIYYRCFFAALRKVGLKKSANSRSKSPQLADEAIRRDSDG